MVIEITRQVDRPAVKIETPGEASIRKPRRPLQEVKPKRHRFLGAAHAVPRGLGKHVGLARCNAQTPKRSPALQRGGIEVLVEGSALPIDPMFEPERPRMVGQPT